jgi:hypothetical protein
MAASPAGVAVGSLDVPAALAQEGLNILPVNGTG